MPDPLIAIVFINETDPQMEEKGNKGESISSQTFYNEYKQNGKG